MIKPQHLKRGDKVAIVSLSSGIIGEPKLIHKFEIGKRRLEQEFGLQVVAMPHALKGSKFVYENPKLRAKDLMDAFADDSIKAIITSIGGDDTIRILPYIDFDVIRNNPKIFMGYSDATINHFMMNKAGLISFYGPCLMVEFAEYVKMFDYTKKSVRDILFKTNKRYEIKASDYWSGDFVPWAEENVNIGKKLKRDEKGYELLQGKGVVKGKLIGGCIDVFPMLVGTEIWPSRDEFKGKILFLETSEDKPSPDEVKWILRGLAAQGIFDVISGVIVGKPQDENYYEEYKSVYTGVIGFECGKKDMPIMYNVNFGHAYPIGIIPMGVEMEIDSIKKTLTLLESPVAERTNEDTKTP